MRGLVFGARPVLCHLEEAFIDVNRLEVTWPLALVLGAGSLCRIASVGGLWKPGSSRFCSLDGLKLRRRLVRSVCFHGVNPLQGLPLHLNEARQLLRILSPKRGSRGLFVDRDRAHYLFYPLQPDLLRTLRSLVFLLLLQADLLLMVHKVVISGLKIRASVVLARLLRTRLKILPPLVMRGLVGGSPARRSGVMQERHAFRGRRSMMLVIRPALTLARLQLERRHLGLP